MISSAANMPTFQANKFNSLAHQLLLTASYADTEWPDIGQFAHLLGNIRTVSYT